MNLMLLIFRTELKNVYVKWCNLYHIFKVSTIEVTTKLRYRLSYRKDTRSFTQMHSLLKLYSRHQINLNHHF